MIKRILKIMLIIVISIVVLIVLFILGLKVFSSYILQRPELHNNIGSIVQLLFPPRDLYKRIITEEIDITKKGEEEVEFKNKYVGDYIVGILLKNFDFETMYHDKPDSILGIEVNFYLDNKLVLSHIEGFKEKKYSPTYGGKVSYESGYYFLGYDCPKDLPINKTIICKIKILEPDTNFNDKYGPVKFFIEKITDY